MSIIKTHDITLYGGNDIDIVLRPLCDEHLTLLYKWCADPEVTYWLDEKPSSKKDVDGIYSYVSSISYCFLIEADGKLIGDCWLENMNIPEIIEMYPNLNVRRIDLTIGEKDWWGKGVGSSVISMMTDFAFYGENVDVIHIVAISDNNIRSQKAFMKNGYKFIKAENVNSPRIKQEYHYRLTRQEYIERRRNRVPVEKQFVIPIAELQPSQLYISEGKLRLVREWFNPDDMSSLDPIPVKRLDGKIVMMDGHTRATAAYLADLESIPVYWDEDELDMRAYAIAVKWCGEEGINSPADFAQRIVPHKDYERLWCKRCMEKLFED